MAKIHKTKNKKLNRLQLGIFISVVAIVLVAAFLFFRPQPSSTNLQDSKTAALKESQDKFIEADRAATLGDYEKGQTILDDALKNKTTNIDRGEVYLQKSTLALNNLHSEDAVKFAEEAEKLNPTRISASVLARTAEKSGDKVLALKYYKLVIERTSEQKKQLAPDDFDDLQSKVKELSS